MKGAVTIKGFEPLAMQHPGECGPTALLQILRHLGRRSTGPRHPYNERRPESIEGRRIGREELVRLWGFREGADRLDTPGHHLRVLRSLRIPAVVRRRLGRREITSAIEAGRPVVLLVPVGLFQWHWVVACGADGTRAVISPGDGGLVTVSWDALKGLRRRGESRIFRLDGLGYAAGLPFPFEPDPALERDLLRLAAVAEEMLTPVEPVLRAARSFAARIGWKSLGPRGNES